MVATQAAPGIGIELPDGTEFGLSDDDFKHSLVGLDDSLVTIDQHASAISSFIASHAVHARGANDPNPLVPPCGAVGNTTTTSAT